MMSVYWILQISFLVSLPSLESGAQKTPDNKNNKGPTVSIKCGQIEGKLINSPNGQCHAYLGVPFAAPPLGDLRWKKPKPAVCWSGTRKATEYGSKCVQEIKKANGLLEGSEDCLYLNVIVPEAFIGSSKKLPVMLFIHGGAFKKGSAIEYGVDGPCENLASRGVIVVIIQYRLFMYGFFSTGDNAALGNYAIWDQIEALRWVSQNIGAFGGDPNRVTIFGQSAGAASVSYLTYTSVAKDLFKQSILQSGSANCPQLGFHESSAVTSKKLALAANCTSSNSNALVNCLRILPTLKLQDVYDSLFNISKKYAFRSRWSARVDGELITDGNFMEQVPGKHVIIGTNTMEMPRPQANKIQHSKHVFNATISKIFRSHNQTKTEILKDKAYSVYLWSAGKGNNATFVEQQISKLQADRDFHAPSAHEATSKVNAGYSAWTYSFNYWSENVFGSDFPFEKGAPHGHELCYLFLLQTVEGTEFFACPSDYKGKHRNVVHALGEMWTNFAINGYPSPKSITWPKFRSTANASTMVISENLRIVPQYYSEIDRFWNDVVLRNE